MLIDEIHRFRYYNDDLCISSDFYNLGIRSQYFRKAIT
jgi:hypothetical protein